MVEHGTVLWFDHSKGHGVIQASGGRLIVVHSDGIKSLTRRGLSDGQAVEYFAEEGPEGVYATHVSVAPHNADRQKIDGKCSVFREDNATPDRQRTEWIALDDVVHFEVTSEDPNHPIEGSLCQGDDRRWRALDAGSKSIRIRFDRPRRVHRVRLHFLEQDRFVKGEPQSSVYEFAFAVLCWKRASRSAVLVLPGLRGECCRPTLLRSG